MLRQVLVHVLFLHRQGVEQCGQRTDFLRLDLAANLINGGFQCLYGNLPLFVHQIRDGRAILGAFQHFIDLRLGIGNDHLGSIDCISFFRKISIDDNGLGNQFAVPAFHLIGNFGNSLTISSLGLDHIFIA